MFSQFDKVSEDWWELDCKRQLKNPGYHLIARS